MTAEQPISVIGDLVVPIGSLLTTIIFTLWLARITRREQRQHLITERDLQYADEFLAVTERLYAWHFLETQPHESQDSVTKLNEATTRFTRFASGADTTLGTYLSGQEQIIWGVLSQGRAAGGWSHEDTDQVQQALSAMRNIVRDWPYPEKRRACLRVVYNWSARTLDTSDVELTIDRWLATSTPSRYWIIQKFRVTWLSFRQLRDDLRYGRLQDRLRGIPSDLQFRSEMWSGRARDRVATKRTKREKIERRRLYEAAARHYRRKGEEPPWGYRIPVTVSD